MLFSQPPPKSNFLFLFSFNCGLGVNAPLVSYAAGGNSLWGFRQGGAVVVFGLAD